MSKGYSDFFEHFEDIYENREQYNISWAFRDAQSKLDDFRNDVIEGDLKSKCFLCKNKDKVDKDYRSMKVKSVTQIKKHRLFSSIFENAYNFLSVFEFLLSFLLVVVISELSHSEGTYILTKEFSAYVFMIFAFVKVVLEQFILRPRMEHLGWKIYKRSVNTLKNLAEEFDDQLVYELASNEVIL